MELDIKEKVAFSCDWLTYSWVREKGKIGLAEFLAQKLGRDDELSLDEASNDSDHNVDVTELDTSEFDVKERTKVAEQARTAGWINVWSLHHLMGYAVAQGWLKPGYYTIRVSW